ncbi:MAG: NAD(P)/FAD-dependent oxidoreductase [Candidatus Thorarchaeota archaeon]
MGSNIQTKVALIGGGPACATAAIQLNRSGVDITLIAKEIGGSIRNANLVENLLGFPEGIKGLDFVNLIKTQLLNNKIPYINEKVESVEYSESRYKIKTTSKEILSEHIIIGTGSIPKKLNIKGEKKAFELNKLYYEVYNVKNLSRNKSMLIIGSGDVAYDYAMSLIKSAESVSIIQRTSKTKSLPILQKRVESQNKIRVVKNREPVEIISENNTVTLLTKMQKRIIPMEADIILVAIGREPNIQFLSDELKALNKTPRKSSTIYFVGDAKEGNYRHVSIAMGDGMNVAMEIVKKLSEKEDYNGTTRQIW